MGGDVVIARTQESLGMQNIDVFDNESIWIFQQMFESLYTVSPDGKSVKPWLATSYDLSRLTRRRTPSTCAPASSSRTASQ